MSDNRVFQVKSKAGTTIAKGVVLPSGKVVVDWYLEKDYSRSYESYDVFLLRVDADDTVI